MSTRFSASARISALAWLATFLASISLFPLFDRKTYLLAGAGVALLVAATGVALRGLRLPLPVVVLGQVAVVVEWVVLTSASRRAAYGFLPTQGVVTEVGRLLRAGSATASEFAPPVPSRPGLVLLTALGIALTALLVDLVAVGLGQVAWAGVPLLALYAVPVATVPHGVPALAFIPGAFGFVALLSAEERERVSHWGKHITRSGQFFPDPAKNQVYTAALAQSGRRIGFAAIGLAVIVPALLPAFPERLWSSAGFGGGAGPIAISNPIVDMRRDLVQPRDTKLLTVVTNAPDPSYLRLTALDVFDGTSWHPSVRAIPSQQQVSAGLPPPPGLDAAVRRVLYRYRISVSKGFASTWLPAFYPAVSAHLPGDWRYDLANRDIVSAREGVTTAGVRYQLESLQVLPTAAQLESAARPPATLSRLYTELPTDLPTEVRTEAQLVTGHAQTDFQRAVALQDWFRSTGGFTYSTNRPSGSSSNALLNFLTKDRKGFCEQFAAAMAVMARSLGIPARVAVGFLHPQQIGPHRFVFSSHDLHSWPELYFQGAGWVRFEPTPSARTGSAPSYTSGVPINTAPGVGGAPSQQSNLGSDIVRKGGQSAAPASRGVEQPKSAGRSPLGRSHWWWLSLALLALLPAGVRALARKWRWRAGRRSDRPAEAAWGELRDTARDLRIRWPDSATPRGTGRALQPRLAGSEDAERALHRLIDSVERARYARSPSPLGNQAGQDVAVISSALRAGVPRSRRWLALLAPTSLVAHLRSWWAGLSGRAFGPSSRTRGAGANAARVGP
jgi:transglutaminase-like putative cysteine protease